MEPLLSWPTLESLITESTEPPRWLVRDLLYQQSLICIAGVPGVGKSVFSYSLAVAVASGQSFLGLPTAQGKVLYFDEENGPANMPTYFRWAYVGAGSPPLDPLSLSLFVGQNAILSDPSGWFNLCLAKAREYRPSLIIFDTSSSCFRITDENDNAEASRVVGNLRLIQAAADNHTSIIILRHARVEYDKDNKRTLYKMRGATAWAGATDGIIFHLAPAGNYHGLRPTYLLPDKTRAYGLRGKLTISPVWTCEDSSTRGIELAGKFD
jgi:RecA-family ATPase